MSNEKTIRQLYYWESKKIAQQLSQSKTWNELEDCVMEDNLFQCTSYKMKKMLFQEMNARFNWMDSCLLDYFLISDSGTAKIILAYTMIKKDSLLFECLRSLYFEKRLFFETELSFNHFEQFFNYKGKKNKKPLKYLKLAKIYLEWLSEVGFVEECEEGLHLNQLIIEPAVANYFRHHGDGLISEILLGRLE
ncbi:BrxA family protein [Carnobacterium gallinarum]|uniref:BrxA family protein n=1 Tax=Carnobacterium gallinarum TaxID=2749 RepID=UPI00055085D9|nr:BrxA family protein [Carnobacterium gallinarum]